MLKINLDNLNIKEIFLKINDYDFEINRIILFYNDLNGKELNSEKIIKIILYLSKYKKEYTYYFYNIPLCFFKKFGRSFIDNHCVRNRLCNYYDGYVSYDKCNKCRYGLFCNNFNSKIKNPEIANLEGFYEETIKKDYLLDIIYGYTKFILELGYKEEDLCFYSTQKYIVEFLEGDIEYISKDYLNYLTIYFLVDNEKISKKIFESLDSFTLVLKDKEIEKKLSKLIKKYGINLNFTIGKGTNLKKYLYNDKTLKLEYYYSRLKYSGERDFFDFTDSLNDASEKNNIFVGKVANSVDIEIEEKVYIIKKAVDLLENKSTIYVGRDILGGMNLNNYKGIIISSDGLGEQGRLVQSFKSIKIPIIYDVSPDLTVYLKDGDNIKINFKTGIIKRI